MVLVPGFGKLVGTKVLSLGDGKTLSYKRNIPPYICNTKRIVDYPIS